MYVCVRVFFFFFLLSWAHSWKKKKDWATRIARLQESYWEFLYTQRTAIFPLAWALIVFNHRQIMLMLWNKKGYVTKVLIHFIYLPSMQNVSRGNCTMRSSYMWFPDELFKLSDLQWHGVINEMFISSQHNNSIFQQLQSQLLQTSIFLVMMLSPSYW